MSVRENPEEHYVSKETEPEIHDIVHYYGAVEDEVKRRLSSFSPLQSVSDLARLSVHIKDSLESLRETQELTTHSDSMIFRPYETEAYKSILEYKIFFASGAILKDDCPRLIDLTRKLESGDSTSYVLPRAGESKLLSHGNFFFFGGSPFIYKVHQDDGNVYKDEQGNPEVHFTVDTENSNYFMNSIYHFKSIPANITFGPPLRSYDYGPQEVNGIGSLIHNFTERVSVFFLTKKALIKGQLVTATLKLVPEGLGCVSDSPAIEFACSENLDVNEILGVYIPYNSTPISTCIFSQYNENVWTVDLNGDGIADLAGVSSTALAEASGGVLSEILWFINLNGIWKIIDYGTDPDCT